MRYRFSPGIPQKIRDSIAAWQIDPGGLAREIVAHLDRLAADPSIGGPDPERGDLYAGASFYQFVIDRPPIILRIAIAYQVCQDEEGEVLQVLDVFPDKRK